jgi:hypothetical protein
VSPKFGVGKQQGPRVSKGHRRAGKKLTARAGVISSGAESIQTFDHDIDYIAFHPVSSGGVCRPPILSAGSINRSQIRPNASAPVSSDQARRRGKQTGQRGPSREVSEVQEWSVTVAAGVHAQDVGTCHDCPILTLVTQNAQEKVRSVRVIEPSNAGSPPGVSLTLAGSV